MDREPEFQMMEEAVKMRTMIVTPEVSCQTTWNTNRPTSSRRAGGGEGGEAMFKACAAFLRSQHHIENGLCLRVASPVQTILIFT